MLRKSLSAIAGLVIAVAIVALIEAVGLAIYPPPAGLDFDGKNQLTQHIKSLPVPVLLFVLLAWAGGAFAGSIAAIVLAGSPTRRGCLIITGDG